MKTPIITAKEAAESCQTLPSLNSSAIAPITYEIGRIPFSGKYKITNTPGGMRLTCPTCGHLVEALNAATGKSGERRPGLQCADCQRRIKGKQTKAA